MGVKLGLIELSGGRMAEIETGCKLRSLIIGGNLMRCVLLLRFVEAIKKGLAAL